jgi:hypothetical protein
MEPRISSALFIFSLIAIFCWKHWGICFHTDGTRRVHYHVCNSLLLVPILSQLNSAHIAWLYFFMTNFNTTLSSTPRIQSGLVHSLATATGHVCGPVGQATHFINANAVTPMLKYSDQPRQSARLKIPYSWTVIIHFISYYIFCELLTHPETVPTYYLLPLLTLPVARWEKWLTIYVHV